MAYSGAGHVDITSRTGGKSLSQFSTGSSQHFSLTEPGVITLSGSPSQVTAYQQQGDDLILHLQNGHELRYQHFFTTFNGEQSELFFEDEGRLQQALFAEGLQSDPQAIIALTPSYDSLESVAQQVSGDVAATASNPATAVGLGLLGLLGAGAGVAAASHGGGGNKTSSAATNDAAAATAASAEDATPGASDAAAAEGTVPVVSDAAAASTLTAPLSDTVTVSADTAATDTAASGTDVVSTTPSLQINSFTGDGMVSAEEKLTSQTLNGTSQNLAEGSALTIGLNGKSYSTTLAADGSWSVEIPAADLQLLPAGDNRFSISFANEAGGTTTASRVISVEASAAPAETSPPQPTIDTPFGDGVMNQQERYEATELTGSTGVSGSGQKIALTIDGVSFAGTVDEQGNWNVPLTVEQLMDTGYAEGEHTIVVTATDFWGRTGTSGSVFTVDTRAPSVTINALSDDNLIDASEINQPLVITGTGEAGSALTVTFGSESWSSTVGEDGQWQFTVSAETLQSLGEGSFVVRASATDGAGNINTTGQSVQIFASDALPELTFNTIAQDNAVNYREGIYGVEITGNSSHLATYTTVELTVDGKTFTGNVYENKWTVQLSDTDLAAIQDGNYRVTVSATDVNGNSTSASQDLLLITHYNSTNPALTTHLVTQADAFERNGETWYTVTGTMVTTLPLVGFAVQSDEKSWRDGVIGENGQWSVEVSSRDLGGTLLFGVQDGAGNWFEQMFTIPVDLETPVGGGGYETLPPTEDNPTDGTPDEESSDDSTTPAVPATGQDAPAPVPATPATGETTSPVPGTPAAGETTPPVSGDASTTPKIGTTSTPNINTPFGDGWLNHVEKTHSETLTGNTGFTGSGQKVTVNISDTLYQTTADANGKWSLVLTSEQLLSNTFSNGKHWIDAFATTADGQTSKATSWFLADVSTPHVTIDTPEQGTQINLSNIADGYTFSGTGDEGDRMTLTLGSLSWEVTVGFNGTWQAELTAEQAQQLEPGAYALQASISDTAKNIGTSSLALEFYASDALPDVSINNLSDDNRLNLNTLTTDFFITGTGEAGDFIDIKLGDAKEWQTTVSQNGTWRVLLSEDDALQLTAGDYALTATIRNANGEHNVATLNVAFFEADVQPTLAMDVVETNDIVDYSTYQNDVELHGESTGLHTGTELTVTLGDKSYIGYVNNNFWFATIPSEDIKAIADGYYSLSVSVKGEGGDASASREVLLLTHAHSSDPVLTFNPLTPEDVVYHGDDAYYVVSGTVTEPLPIEHLSFYGGEMLNTYDITVAEDGTFTAEIPASEFSSTTYGPDFYVNYQDAAGNWERSWDSVVLPTAPAPVIPDPIAAPEPTLDAPFADGWLNREEKTHDETLSGTTGTTGSGQKVVVNISGTDFQATVTDEGNWSLLLTTEVLKGKEFSNGQHDITVTATGADGQTGTVSNIFTVDTCLPKLTINNFSDDNRVDLSDTSGLVTLSGTGDAYDYVNVMLGSLHEEARVREDGKWSANFSVKDIIAQGLGDYTVTATIKDDAGNVSNASLDVDFYLPDVAPTISVDAINGDDMVNASEAVYGILITGSSTGLANNAVFTVTLDGKEFRGSTSNDSGDWSVRVDASAVKTIADGYYTFTVSSTSLQGQTASATHDVLLLADGSSSIPAVTYNVVTQDDAIYHNYEGSTELYYTVTGTLTETFPLESVSLKGQYSLSTYPITVNDDGTWSTEVRATEFGSEGGLLLYVGDVAGNYEQQDAIVPTDLPSGSLPDIPNPTIDIPFDDNWLNLEEKSQDETLSGTTGVSGSGQQVTVNISGTDYQATVTEGGDWNLVLTPEIMAGDAFADGKHAIYVTVTDASGREGTVSSTFTADSVIPDLSLNGVGENNQLDIVNLAGTVYFTGTGTPEEDVAVTFGTLDLGTARVAYDGTWSVSTSASALQQLGDGDYTLSATTKDEAGNPNSATLDVDIVSGEPVPTVGINVVNYIDAAGTRYATTGFAITGTALHLPEGATLNVTLDGLVLPAVIRGSAWTAQVSAAQTQAIADGQYTLTATAMDANGDSLTSADRSIWMITHANSSLPTVTYDDITLADAVTIDGKQYYTVTGTVSGDFPYRYGKGAVSITVDTYGDATGMLNADGTFSVAVAATMFRHPQGDSQIVLSVYDIAQNHETTAVQAVPTDLVTPVTTASSTTVTEDNPTDSVSDTADHDVATADASTTDSATTESSVTDSSAPAVEDGMTVADTATSSHSENIDGQSHVVGTEGNDNFTLASLSLLTNLDGGAGHDTLTLSGTHEALDFAALGLEIKSIETLDLGASGSNSVTLGQQDLLQLTADTLTIKGADGNTVTLSTTEGGVWSDVGQRAVDGQLYDLYHNSSASHEGTLADVLIQHNLQVQTA